MRIAKDVHLDGVGDDIRVSFMVAHDKKVSQNLLEYAQLTFAQVAHNPGRDVKIFIDRAGSVRRLSFETEWSPVISSSIEWLMMRASGTDTASNY